MNLNSNVNKICLPKKFLGAPLPEWYVTLAKSSYDKNGWPLRPRNILKDVE